ncbi:MAG: hypothetical protein M5T61_21135 [Acidimicrobiia bacterium]|nr:hypothetical protein [Acidimicrobiia bacterium]
MIARFAGVGSIAREHELHVAQLGAVDGVDRVRVWDDAVAHHRIHPRIVLCLVGPAVEVDSCRRADAAKGVVIKHSVTVEEVDLVDRGLGDEIEHVRSRSTRAHDRDLRERELLVDGCDASPRARGVRVPERRALIALFSDVIGPGGGVRVDGRRVPTEDRDVGSDLRVVVGVATAPDRLVGEGRLDDQAAAEVRARTVVDESVEPSALRVARGGGEADRVGIGRDRYSVCKIELGHEGSVRRPLRDGDVRNVMDQEVATADLEVVSLVEQQAEVRATTYQSP